MQKILVLTTRGEHLRSAVVGQLAEDADGVRPGPVELAPAWDAPRYETPLHALGDGWALLAPPVRRDGGALEWWLTKT